MKITEKEHKKMKKMMNNNSVKTTIKRNDSPNTKEVPIWFNKDLENEELSKEDALEIDKILEELV